MCFGSVRPKLVFHFSKSVGEKDESEDQSLSLTDTNIYYSQGRRSKRSLNVERCLSVSAILLYIYMYMYIYCMYYVWERGVYQLNRTHVYLIFTSKLWGQRRIETHLHHQTHSQQIIQHQPSAGCRSEWHFFFPSFFTSFLPSFSPHIPDLI